MASDIAKHYEQHDAPEWTSNENHYHSKNPHLHSVYGPIKAEHSIDSLEVIEGEVPKDLTGVYIRNGSNPRFESKGPHHWFDGDGMIHALNIKDGNVSLKNKWVRTKHFNMESEVQKAIWPGYANIRPDPEAPKGGGSDFAIKDASNTDVIWYNGAIFSTFYQTGIPYRVNPVTLETEGQETFNSKLPRQVSAHCKVDDATGEIMFFDYNMEEPYMTYGVGDKNGNLTNFTEIPLPGPRLPHDMAITENYSILMDLPLHWDDEQVKRGQYSLHFYKDKPSRFAVIPRHGSKDDIQWFDAKACYMYHTVNAYEKDGKVIMDGCAQQDPLTPRKPGDDIIDRMEAASTWKDVRLYRWVFDLATGEITEGFLDDTNVEFPMMNFDQYIGKEYRYIYATLMPKDDLISFNGIYKLDLQTKEKQIYEFPEGKCASETPFSPADNATDEDDGYLVCFLTDIETGESEANIFDAKDISKGPVCRLAVPYRVPAGFHSCWVNAKKLASTELF